MPNQKDRAVLSVNEAVRRGHIVVDGGKGILRAGNVQSLCLQQRNYLRPARAIGPGSMYQYDVLNGLHEFSPEYAFTWAGKAKGIPRRLLRWNGCVEAFSAVTAASACYKRLHPLTHPFRSKAGGNACRSLQPPVCAHIH